MKTISRIGLVGLLMLMAGCASYDHPHWNSPVMADCKEEFPYYTTTAKIGTPKRSRYDACVTRHSCVTVLGLTPSDIEYGVGAAAGYASDLGSALTNAALASDCRVRKGSW